MTCAFFVAGQPTTQGSKRLVRGRMIEALSKKLKPWRAAVGWAARLAWNGPPMPLAQAVAVTLEFRFVRPSKPSRSYPCSGGGLDTEKLVRAVHDALTGIVWEDDSQCVDIRAIKIYADVAGVHVEVRAA